MTGPRQMTGSVSCSSSRFTLISWMPVSVCTGRMASSEPTARPWMPKHLGMEGPVTSASRMAVRWPRRCMVTANWLVTMDLPTPPLPETTAMTFFTCEFLLGSASRLSCLRSEQLSPQLEQLPLHPLIIKTLLLCRSLHHSITGARKVNGAPDKPPCRTRRPRAAYS